MTHLLEVMPKAAPKVCCIGRTADIYILRELVDYI
jgi:hypothetical protein